MPQSLSCVLIHLVFSTKNREPWIRDNIEQGLHAYLGGILRDLECPSLIIGGTADHVHILFRLARTKAISAVVEEVKTGSRNGLRHQRPVGADRRFRVRVPGALPLAVILSPFGAGLKTMQKHPHHSRIDKAIRTVGRRELFELISGEFPDVSAELRDNGEGLLHVEVAIFREATERAMDAGHFWTVEKHFRFVANWR